MDRAGQRHLSIVLFFATVLMIPIVAAADTQPASLDDRAALEAWTDGTMNALLEANHTAGGVVAIVRNGEVVLAKGYGFADVADRVTVDPAKTLFRIGSVSKLFVWISVMQLIEQGKLDLTADVSTYLDGLRVPKWHGQPVTMKQLLTHTPGFEDQVLGLFSHDPASMRPLEQVLRQEMPARVREPGRYASYSNHGTGLAMHVVERIYGAPWEKYIADHILAPLNLNNTILAQPVPEEFAADVSKGYRWRGQVFEEQKFELVPLGPVGGVSTTAMDMATLMQMFLNLGEYGGARVLEADTARTMQTTLHIMAPGTNGQAHGMLDMSRPGLRVVGHDGDTLWFHTSLSLFPEHYTGVFVSFNTDTGAAARSQFIEQFENRYFIPRIPEKLAGPAGFGARAAKYTGSFRPNRFSHRSLAKVATALGPVTVSYDGKDALLLSLTGKKRWVEVAPNSFQDEDGDRRIVFIEDADGTVNHFVFSDNGIFAFERNSPIAQPLVHGVALLGTAVICLLAVICWPIAAIVRWKHDVILARGGLISLPARLLGWVSCAAVLVFVVMFVGSASDPLAAVFGLPPTFPVLLWIPIGVAVLTLGMIFAVVLQWKNGRGTFLARLGYLLVTLALCVYVFQAVYWNLTYVQNLRFL